MIKTTPDLSAEFHPVPKTFKAKKVPKPLKQVGKKTSEWNSAREDLKKEFNARGIRQCEIRLKGCWERNALTFAHVDKRRNLTAEELRHAVVLACTPCHQAVEAMPHEEMREMLENIIERRMI